MFIAAYAGARPAGRPLPLLKEVPQFDLPLHLIYSFARDANKDGNYEFYDPWYLETACQQQCGNQRGMLALAGAGFAWGPAVDQETWVANAVSSLKATLEKYNLVGLDINYEEGLESGGFPEAMAALITQLKAWNPALIITVAPYRNIWQHYKELLQLAGDKVDYVNWQLYGELESPETTADEAVAVYDALAQEVGGFGKLLLGVNTEPDAKRGPQKPAVEAAFRTLKGKGIGGAFVWALDNSPASMYETEVALFNIAGEQ